MATNEIFKEADYLSLPVPEGTVSGDPVLVGELVGVAQTSEGDNSYTSTPIRRAMDDPAWNTVPASTGGNEAGFASVALKGAFAFEIDGGDALTHGTAVGISEGTGPDGRNVLVTGAGDARFGHVVGHTSDGRVVVRIANPVA